METRSRGSFAYLLRQQLTETNVRNLQTPTRMDKEFVSYES